MIHLKVKTEYSFGQTFAPIDRVIQRLKEIGCTAAGIVDGSTWGHVRWFNACKAAGIQPLLGVECVVTDDETTHRMWFLAKNKDGLAELYRATSKSHQQKVPTKYGSVPRLYRNDVLNMSDNIFKFAGDIVDAAFLKEAGAIVDLNPASKILNVKKKRLAIDNHLPLCETADNAYAYTEDKEVFELTSKAGNKATPQYLMEDLGYEACATGIAIECEDLELPIAPMIHEVGDLEALCREGIKFRGMEDSWTQLYEERLMYELELIKTKDYESYFLVVADMMCYAKEHMLVGPARGSSAGSLVCYLTRITEVDPIPPGLIFERFIDISRADLPDIDTDFPDNKRQMVFDYMAEKYGVNNVAHIGTIGQFRPKSALIQVCKALNIPPQATGAVKVAMIERSSADSRANNCLEDTFNETAPGQEFIKQYPQARSAMLLEGHASHTGVHAAGLLVCNDEITNYATVDADGIAHVEKGAAESVGLLKIDVLGLRTLGVIEDSGVDVDWYNLPFDDPATYEIFNSGKFCGIFQFEGNALRAVSSDVDFEDLGDIDAVTALARPGPFGGGVTEEFCARKKGKHYTPMHPAIDEHLKATYGLPVYQEQTMNIVRHVGKFDWKDTSVIRKAMSKRLGKEFFDKHYEKFEVGAAEQGVSSEEARKTWDLINSFGAWAFNKSHSHSYAVVSYWTAYLKAHFPLEFAAANLRNAKDEDSAIELLREMAREGQKFVPFDLEKSEANWSVKDGVLYGGFMALKGFGEKKAEKMIEARNNGMLTEKNLEDINKAENSFDNIFPFHTNYQHLYDDPAGNGIASDIVEIADLNNVPHAEERVFLGELIYKNARNYNEEVNVKKRGGKVGTGPLEFVDMRLRDDSGMIGARIGRFDFNKIGKELLERTPTGAHLLVRAKFFNNIRFAFVTKWRRLDG